MRKKSLILLLALISAAVCAQKDPEAKKILDKLSARSEAEYPIEVNFEYIYEDLMEKQTTTYKGSLIIDETRFRLSLDESIVVSDGITVWNYLVSANEVYVSDAEESTDMDEYFISNPSDLFTFYREGFKYRLTGEVEYTGRTYSEIDIFPEDLDRNYHTVKLLVDKKDLRIYSAQAYGKQGANHTVILTGYKTGVKTDDKTFSFDPAAYPGVEVVDTRF
jgi:outer membrane lipoprotein-sorting protein